MDPKKKIVELTPEELAELGYLTDRVAPGVKSRVEKVLANPELLGSVTVFMVECTIRRNSRRAAAPGAADPLAPPTSPTSHPSPTSTVSDADTLFSHYSSNPLAFTVVAPDLITNPPPLLWRSNLEENPFPAPAPRDRYFSIPVKTAYDAIGTLLDDVWPTVAPAILASLKSRGIKYSAVQPVRFSIVESGRDAYLGPVVSDDAQGTLTFFFREVQTKDGKPSSRILGVTNKHVACLDTTTHYEFQETDPQHILVCGDRRFALAINAIEEKDDDCFRDLLGLTEQLTLAGMKAEWGETKYVTALRRKKTAHEEKTVDSNTLQALFDEVNAKWADVNERRLKKHGIVPRIGKRGCTRS